MFPSGTETIREEARAELQEFYAAGGQIVNSWTKRVERREPPNSLYQYTNDAGLRGILESGCLWFTNIFDFNDPSELKHGASLAAAILKKKANSGPLAAKRFAARFERFAKHGGAEASAHYFACCFSTRGDDLGQWRAYADNGRGFALEFKADELVGPFANEGRSTFPITYNDEELSAIHTQLVERAYPLIESPHTRGMEEQELRDYLVALSSLLAMYVLAAGLYFKHEAYANEAEFRFLQLQRGDQPAVGLKLRSRPYTLVRYREFDWKGTTGKALKRVVIGPSANKDTNEQFARKCLLEFHPDPDSVEIVSSNIPYRAQ